MAGPPVLVLAPHRQAGTCGTLGPEGGAATTFLERSRRRKRAGKIWRMCSAGAQLLSACPEVMQLFERLEVLENFQMSLTRR